MLTKYVIFHQQTRVNFDIFLQWLLTACTEMVSCVCFPAAPEDEIWPGNNAGSQHMIFNYYMTYISFTTLNFSVSKQCTQPIILLFFVNKIM